jgi:hypothetical protein
LAFWAFKTFLVILFLALTSGSFLLYWATFWANRFLCLGLSVVRGVERALLWGIEQTGALAENCWRNLQTLWNSTIVFKNKFYHTLEGPYPPP